MKSFFIPLFLVCLALPCFSQRPPMGGPPPAAANKPAKMKKYKVSKEETIHAIAGDVVVSTQGKTNMLCLSATAEGKTWAVLLGESGITRDNVPRIASGQEITIIGIKNEHKKKGNTIRPREIVLGNSTLALLDKDGRPIHMPNIRPGDRQQMPQGGPSGRGGGQPRRR
jgi:hypothetical protein